MKKIICIFICLTMFLSGCGTLEISFDVTPALAAGAPAISDPATSTPAPAILLLDSASEEIQQIMLESATKWNTIWMDGTVTWYDSTGSGNPPQVFHEQVWLDQSANRFRVLMGPVKGDAEAFKVCDGITILEMDLKNGQSQSQPLLEFAKTPHYVPTLEPGVAYPNPIWGQIGTPLSELAFSANRAQNQGTFVPVAIENIAGRQALAVEWTHIDNNLPTFKAWLDVETGVILKIQEFGKSGGDLVQSELVVDQVDYDVPLDDNLFSLQLRQMPAFSDIFGNPLLATETAPTLSSESDPLGQVYFFISDHVYGNETTELLRLPGSCVVGETPCPKPETIATPFGLNFSLTSLVWSPNGKYAALAYPISQDGQTTELFLFDPENQSWHPLVEFRFIDPPIWSPDGNWLAFRVQDGEGNSDIYAVRRSGSGLTNLTASEKLPAEGRPYVLHGWINDNVILRSVFPGKGGLVYLRRVSDGFTKPLFEAPWTKSDMVPSPDGSLLVYPDISEQKTSLKLLSPDGNTFRELATFQSGSIYPIIWSPDGVRIVFARIDSEPIDGQDVYEIGRDGRNLQQIYHSNVGGISSITFSLDGQYLLIQDDDSTGRHIYVVNLSTLETNMLRAPGLPLDWWWLAPSWRP